MEIFTIIIILAAVLIIAVDIMTKKEKVRAFWAFLTPVYLTILLVLASTAFAFVSGGDWWWLLPMMFLYIGGIAIVVNTIILTTYLHFTKRLRDCLNHKEKRSIWITFISIVIVVAVIAIPNMIIGKKAEKEGKEFSQHAICNIQEETIRNWEMSLDVEITQDRVDRAYKYIKENCK